MKIPLYDFTKKTWMILVSMRIKSCFITKIAKVMMRVLPYQHHQPRCPVELNLDPIQNDASFPLWLYNFGNTIVEDHASALGNTLNLKTSMFEMGNENPTRVGNDGINSFGSSSIGFHAMEPNI